MFKNMKKWLAAAMSAALVVSAVPSGVYADSRETDFFADNEHPQVAFEDLELTEITAEEFGAKAEELLELAADEANVDSVGEKLKELNNIVAEIILKLQVYNIFYASNITDAGAYEAYMDTYDLYVTAWDEYHIAVRELLDSPCAAAAGEMYTEEDIEWLREYEEMDEEEMRLIEEEEALVNEYYALQYQTFTTEYGGEQIDYNMLYEAYAAGAIDYDTYNEIYVEILKEQNAAMGNLYLRMVEQRNRIAQYYGYDNYADYGYAEVYLRDYTTEDIQKFHEAVKGEFVDVYNKLYTLYAAHYNDEILYTYLDTDTLFALMKEYIPEISSELGESLDYLIDYNYYDFEYRPEKTEGAATYPLGAAKAAYVMIQPYGDVYDFFTAVHEFGHYNEAYQVPLHWEYSSSIDIAEIHSQGLELLIEEYVPDIFGEGAEAISYCHLSELAYAIIQGCMHDELQQYAYTEEDLTLEKLNKKYLEILVDYGLRDAADLGQEAYSWVSIPHTFTSPMYYISYAVSAAAAFEIWLESQEDYFGAVDRYLTLVSYGYEYSFSELLEQSGLSNPLTEEGVKELAGKITEVYELDAKLQELMQPEPEPEPEYKIYTVKSGDTLAKIAKAHGIKDWKEIAQINNLEAPYTIYAGKNILLPEGAKMNSQTYTVQSGDTLGKIGAAYGVDWRLIAEKNNIEAPYTIYVGQKLTIED